MNDKHFFFLVMLESIGIGVAIASGDDFIDCVAWYSSSIQYNEFAVCVLFEINGGIGSELKEPVVVFIFGLQTAHGQLDIIMKRLMGGLADIVAG